MSVLLVAVGLYLTNSFNRDQLKVQRESTQEQQDLALKGQRADRFVAAVEQLGQEGIDKLSIRLGGIYSLQGLMRDSPADEPSVIEVLSAFVRTHAPRPAKELKATPVSPADVRAAVTVIGLRPHPEANERIDLSNTLLGLDNIDLDGADLAGVNLEYADLTAASLRGANLNNVLLNKAKMSEADLRNAVLQGANMAGAELSMAHLEDADLRKANLGGANLVGADLDRADLRKAGLDHAHVGLCSDSPDGKATRCLPPQVSLKDTNLEGASLVCVDLRGVMLSDSQRAGAVFEFDPTMIALTPKERRALCASEEKNGNG